MFTWYVNHYRTNVRVVSSKTEVATCVDCGGAESLPDNGFTDVGGNEEWNAGTQTIALLQELIKQKHDETGNEQLDDDEQAHASANIAGVTVHSSHNINNSLSNGDDHTEH